MMPSNPVRHESLGHWIVVRPEPAGQFTAQLLGLPELSATAASREEAIAQVRGRILESIALGQLVPVEIPKEHPLVGTIPRLEESKRSGREDLPSASSTLRIGVSGADCHCEFRTNPVLQPQNQALTRH